MCAFTEPVRTGIGAVCVEYGRRKRPITMLNHTEKHPWCRNMIVFFFNFCHPMLVRPARKRLLCLKAKNVLGRFAPSALPHYYTGSTLKYFAVSAGKLLQLVLLYSLNSTCCIHAFDPPFYQRRIYENTHDR